MSSGGLWTVLCKDKKRDDENKEYFKHFNIFNNRIFKSALAQVSLFNVWVNRPISTGRGNIKRIIRKTDKRIMHTQQNNKIHCWQEPEIWRYHTCHQFLIVRTRVQTSRSKSIIRRHWIPTSSVVNQTAIKPDQFIWNREHASKWLQVINLPVPKRKIRWFGEPIFLLNRFKTREIWFVRLALRPQYNYVRY